MNSYHSEPLATLARHCQQSADSLALSQALRTVLPEGLYFAVATVCIGSDASSALQEHAARHPDEASIIRNAVPKRLFEFLATRELARALLLEMGESAASIPRGTLGAPLWPQGIVGTIAHSHGLIVVALGKTQQFSSLGIDLEPNQPLPEDVRDYVTLAGEDEGAPASRALFVVKEAFYKAHCGIHQRMLEFTDVRVAWQPNGFCAQEIQPPPNAIGPTSLCGTLAVTAEWLAAFCAISSK